MSQFIEMFGDPMTNTKAWVEFGYIGNYTQIVLGTTPNSKNSSYWNGEIKWITPAEMTEESYYIYDTERHLTEEGLKAANLTLLPCRSVLFSTRAPIGKVGLVGSPMYCNQGFKNFVCGDQLNPVYLYYSLIFKREYLVSLGTGTTFKELSKKAVENLKIAVPPLILQNKFEEIYQQADKSKFGDFKSQFIEMFGNPTNETVGKLGNELFSFASGKANIKSNLDPSFQYNCYGGNGITGKSKEYLLKDKTIVIGRVGEYCGCVHQTSDYCWVTDNAIYLKTYSDIYRFKFIYYMFVMMDFHRYASETGQPKITQAPLLSCTYPIPTLEAQDIFISIAEQADKSKSVIQKALVYLNDIQSDELGKIA